MWRESYRMGVDVIDNQHMELFRMAGDLLDVVENGKGDNKKECIEAITYLKNYTVQHFSDEEDYQKSIGYEGLDVHKLIHQKFVRCVLSHERKMSMSGFNTKDVKDFMGMLIAWLVYHVAGTDQLIVANKQQENKVRHSSFDTYFRISAYDTINKLNGLDKKSIKVLKQADGDFQSTIAVRIDLYGETSGTVTYKFTKQLAFDLMRSMTSFSPEAIDELVCSAMLEISNIISVKAIGLMSANGFSCDMDNPVMEVHPAYFPSHDSIIFDTGTGILEVEVSINKG